MTPTDEDVAALKLKLGNLIKYLDILSNATKRDYDKKVIEDCLAKFKRLFYVVSSFNAGNLSFVDVLFSEYEKFTASIVDGISNVSNNFTEFSSNYDIINYIYTIHHMLEENVFIANPVFQISNGLVHEHKSVHQVLKDYLKIGEELKNEEAVQALKNDLSLLKFSSDDPNDFGYYAAIIGPSFMGKTQTAFTLSHLMNVMYVNLLSIDPQKKKSTPIKSTIDLSLSQAIYNAFLNFSELFSLTIEADLLEKELENYSSNHLSNYKPGFQTLGLLYCLIRRKSLNMNETAEENFLQVLNIKNALIPKMNCSQFLGKIAGNLNYDFFTISKLL